MASGAETLARRVCGLLTPPSMDAAVAGCPLPSKVTVCTLLDDGYLHTYASWIGRVSSLTAGEADVAVIALTATTEAAVLAEPTVPACVVLYTSRTRSMRGRMTRHIPRLIGAAKFELTAALLRRGKYVLFSEMDVVWLRSPLDELSAITGFPIVGQPADTSQFINFGFFYASPVLAGFFSFVQVKWEDRIKTEGNLVLKVRTASSGYRTCTPVTQSVLFAPRRIKTF